MQETVDTRLVADIVVASLRDQVSDIVLVSGDVDMLPDVAETSAVGVCMHFYGFGWGSMSDASRHAYDSTTILDPREDFADAMQLNVLEGPILPVIRANRPLGDAEPIEDLGVTYVPDACTTLPGEDSLDDGTENTPSAANGDVASPEAGTPEVPQSQHVVPSPTTDRDSDCHSEDNIVVTPTAKADSSKFNEVEHTAKMGAREIPAQAERHAKVKQTGGSETIRMGSATSGVSAVSPTQQTQQTQPAQPSPVAMLGTTGNTGNGADNDTVNSTGVEDVGASASNSASSTTTGDGESAMEPLASEDDTNMNTPKPSPRPNPSMMALRRKPRSRYVPLLNEVRASVGFQTPFGAGRQYANWQYEDIVNERTRDSAHSLSGGGLSSDTGHPLLQLACETLHKYVPTEVQHVDLRDGFYAGIHGVPLARKNDELEKQRASQSLQFRWFQRCWWC